MNIYIVEAFFEDFESSYKKIIGLFTDEKNAEIVKYKWLDFFKQKDLFNKPDGWDPKSDKWYDDDDELYFDWTSSYDYQTLISKYRYIKSFIRIEIQEVPINKELIIDKLEEYIDLTNLMKEFDRDWKLNKLIK